MEGLKVNQPIDLEILIGGEWKKFRTRVEEVTPEALAVSDPFVGWIGSVPAGAAVKGSYSSDQSAVYKFQSIIEKRAAGPVPLLFLKVPREVERVQRREFFRLDVDIAIRIQILKNDVPEGGFDPKAPPPVPVPAEVPVKTGQIKDMSAGGLCMILDMPLADNTLLEVYLDFPDGRVLRLIGQALRTIKTIETKKQKAYWLAVKFIGANDRDRDLITSFIFKEQLRRRRQGLI